jgi:hypothetical protein
MHGLRVAIAGHTLDRFVREFHAARTPAPA